MHIVESNITSSCRGGVTCLDLPHLNTGAAFNQDNCETILSEICHARQWGLVVDAHIRLATHCEATLSGEMKIDETIAQMPTSRQI